jgi:tetratricopeptide (TPR) repeat protein
MSIWKRLFGHDKETVDYYDEGLELLNAGKYHEALTSFRLALRDTPFDATVLQQIAITYTRIGMTDEAIRTYRKALTADSTASGAHYGLAFLLLREGRPDEAAKHLRTFLDSPPDGAEAQRHIEHAREALKQFDEGRAGEKEEADG